MTGGALRHFLDLDQIAPDVLRSLTDQGLARKKARKDLAHGVADGDAPLKGHVVALIFEKPSTRTRVSFDVGMRQLGGEAMTLSAADMQLGRGETISDTARVLSRYVDGIMLRTSDHANLLELATSSTIPVINGLTNKTHPCQLMADIMTFEEYKGPIKDQIVAWSGDGNNVAASWIQAAVQFEFELRLACPPDFKPNADILDWAKNKSGRVQVVKDPRMAVDGADCIVTDSWVSMGDTNPDARRKALSPYQVNASLMACAAKDAIFMHCLPAHRGEEVTDEVIDGPQSAVLDEAENRLHAQKAILVWCLKGREG
jgi:ornithine carbamoyltransferase